ncbi:hypothetical protein CBL_07286 [Carabus blaptoides fortunei]
MKIIGTSSYVHRHVDFKRTSLLVTSAVVRSGRPVGSRTLLAFHRSRQRSYNDSVKHFITAWIKGGNLGTTRRPFDDYGRHVPPRLAVDFSDAWWPCRSRDRVPLTSDGVALVSKSRNIQLQPVIELSSENVEISSMLKFTAL